jgi:tyrosinase
VLSRWHAQYCANCQTHLEVGALFDVPAAGEGAMALATEDQLADTNTYQVEIQARDALLAQSEPPQSAVATGQSPTRARRPRALHRLEVR